jgi:hypothetical protein
MTERGTTMFAKLKATFGSANGEKLFLIMNKLAAEQGAHENRCIKKQETLKFYQKKYR